MAKYKHCSVTWAGSDIIEICPSDEDDDGYYDGQLGFHVSFLLFV